MSMQNTIAGIGIDLLYMDRIEDAWQKRGMRFASKILGEEELLCFSSHLVRHQRRALRFLASRFSAKEAFSKAVGLGIRLPMRWQDCQILNATSGQPYCILSGALLSWYSGRFGAVHVSLTDESRLVSAYVVVEALKQ